MTTYTDEVNIYNPDAISGAIDDAGNAYKTYITEVTSDGIMVAAAGKGTSNGSIVSTTTGWHLSDVLEWVRNGISRFWIGLKNQGDTTPTVRIGKAFVNGANDNESYMELDYHSMRLIDKEGDAYFHVSDLRDANGLITDVYTGDGITTKFYFSTIPRAASSVAIWVDDIPKTSGVSNGAEYMVFTTAPANGAIIKAQYAPYTSQRQYLKAFTFGVAKENTRLGQFSVRAGYDCAAVGYCSRAEGYNAKAEGSCSHAEGYASTAQGAYSHTQNLGTIAISDSQTALGKYNIDDTYTDTFTSDHWDWDPSVYLSYECNRLMTITIDGEMFNGNCHLLDDNRTLVFDTVPPNGSTIVVKYLLNKYAVIVGNGTSDSARSNALTTDWSGGAQLWHPDIERGTAPSSSIYGGGGTLQLVDKDGHQIGYLQPIQLANGTEGIQLGVSNSDSTDWNTVQLAFDSNDNPTVSVSDADKWRNALGITDSGWQTLTLGSAAKAYDSDVAPVYRKCFNVVNLVGAVSPKSQVAAGGEFDVGVLPTGYRPRVAASTVCQGSGNSVYLLRIGTNGNIRVERYRNGASVNAAISTTTWLPFNVTFICA